jgi:hypothetical protein
MSGGGPALPRRNDVRTALSPRSDMQHKMHNMVDYVLGAQGPSPKVAGIESTINRMNITNGEEINGAEVDNMADENCNGNDNEYRSGGSSRQGSPQEEEDNGNCVKEEQDMTIHEHPMPPNLHGQPPGDPHHHPLTAEV